MSSRHRLDESRRYIAKSDLPPERADIEGPTSDPEKPANRTVYRELYDPGSPLSPLIEVVNLAIALGRPLLLQGEPGCGKTRLAYAVAYELGHPLEECYIKSTSRAQDLLYIYDAINRLYDAQLGEKGPLDTSGQPKCNNPQNYVRLGPLGRAIFRAQLGRPSVVLIDEIDKADLDFPNDLLFELDRLKFEVAEAPGMKYAVPEEEGQPKPELRPLIIITHNEEKALPTAFLRRCVFHYLKFPKDPEHLKKILKLHEVADEATCDNAVDAILNLRKVDLAKKPGLSEFLDWVVYVKKFPSTPLAKWPYIQLLVKHQSDLEKVEQELKKANR